MKLLLIVLSVLLLGIEVQAKVEIGPYRHSSWNNSWNDSIYSELEVREDEAIMSQAINSDDLQELNCPGYNSVTDNDLKKDFWVVFLASLTRAESGFNTKVRARSAYGLLQLSKSTARVHCGLRTMEDITDPAEHLRCGVKLLSWQLAGAPTTSGKLRRPDLKGQLFGKHILLWGPLRQNDKRGRALLVNWFKSHLDQLPFCKA